MELYVEIIDSHRVRSNTNLVIEGIPASRAEWNKYSFYPNNGVVGVVIGEAYVFEGKAYILKCGPRIFVPIICDGVKVITSMEYRKRYSNNMVVGKITSEKMNSIIDVDEFLDTLNNFR